MEKNPACPVCRRRMEWDGSVGQLYCEECDIFLSDEDIRLYREDPVAWLDMMGYGGGDE